MHSALSALARAILESLEEGVVVFDATGKFLYANAQAQAVIMQVGTDSIHAKHLLPRLAHVGGRIAPMWSDGTKLGQVVHLPPREDGVRGTLAQQEQDAILQTLETTGWRLTESARRLGISRTTLWRRLKLYGLQRDNRGRWAQPS